MPNAEPVALPPHVHAPAEGWAGVVVVGSTASGKSALGMALARRLPVHAEIVSVDSMQVYRRMDIGTAKPPQADQRAVPHHLIDIAEPSDTFSAAWFQQEATAVRADLSSRGVFPLWVGGTGLYHRVVIDELELPGQFPEVSAELDELSTSEIYAQLCTLDPAGAERMEPTNRRRALRALEVCVGSGKPFSSYGDGMETYQPSKFLFIGLEVDRAVLSGRIAERLDRQISEGFVSEVESLLAETPGPSKTALQALGYREIAEHLHGGHSLAEALDLTRIRTRKFAVRQHRWFRRDQRIVWIDADRPTEQVASEISELVERSASNGAR